MNNTTDKRDEKTYAIIGAAMAVHNELGCGFLEAVYQDALEIEFKKQGIPYEREKRLDVFYCGEKLDSFYRVDFLCFNEVVVETKAVSKMAGTEESQVINQMKASRLHKALLINFGVPKLDYKRMVFNLCESA
ncbi:MAG: GxxExxY protein [Pontiellaceae bacterium]|nr:GxxExxY protein [Pontiellaceae bacterium]